MGKDYIPTYKMYYFKETDYFMAKARVSSNIMMVNISTNSVELCNNVNKFTTQTSNNDDYSIIYNDSIKDSHSCTIRGTEKSLERSIEFLCTDSRYSLSVIILSRPSANALSSSG